MSINSSNQLTIPITDELRAQTLTTFEDLKNKVDLGIALTDAERAALKKVGNRSRDMLRDLQSAINDFAAIQPERSELEDLMMAVNTFDFADGSETRLLELLKRVEDAKYFAGAKAYKICMTAYGILKVLADKKGGVYKTRYDDLQKKHFSKGPRGGGNDKEAPSPPAS